MSEKPVSEMAFEEALGELEAIVRKLEAGEESLDASIALFQRGEALKRHCEARLADARERIDKIMLDAEGKPKATEPFDAG
ncbi:exodeoxyribonuclease VII small subunit [Sphingomicrobium sediminis]|uniref:Exodeoxyribonuclease 7 small subunit n=1 Tax=Sphingomicrobium sediminis TaxID=2950949 RepID=A0A9X2EGT2_9SPHN|nr:exodeoxyribonuclease VII small subunit [Sphingomicrobium sediminis]MCM8556396.1 exodeoxyribonuclease VII small subunit [Sphingomicrobium sediminis]